MIFQNKYFFLLMIILSFVEANLTFSKQLNSTYLIYGGLPKDEYDLGRFVVSIRKRTHIKPTYGYHHFCGGTIISPTKILTAAHCLYNKKKRKNYQPYELVVVVGSTFRFIESKTTREMNVASVTRHKLHTKHRSKFGDVGFLILENEILFDNPHVGVINMASSEPTTNKKCTVIGFGRLYYEGPSSDRILFADVEILSYNFCKQKYGKRFHAGMLCAGDPETWKRDSCSGDSGGPLICDDEVVGIVSLGFKCGSTKWPGVYTDVYYFREWISSISKGPRVDANYFITIFLTSIVLYKDQKICLRLRGS